jgi:hypothetical protein
VPGRRGDTPIVHPDGAERRKILLHRHFSPGGVRREIGYAKAALSELLFDDETVANPAAPWQT